MGRRLIHMRCANYLATVINAKRVANWSAKGSQVPGLTEREIAGRLHRTLAIHNASSSFRVNSSSAEIVSHSLGTICSNCASP